MKDSQVSAGWREILGLAGMTVVFLAVNLATAARYPMPWVDEIQFSDAAVNLYLGKGFTSTVWIAQTSDAFWAGNTPLYTGLLYLWISLFGVSAEAVRSLNFVLMSGVVWLVWLFAKRSQLVPKPGYRLLLAALLFTGHALTFSFRMGRYDVLGMLLFALASLAWIGPAGWRQRFTIASLATVAPFTGLQLLPASVLYCGLLFLFQGRPAILKIVAVGFGLALGVGGLYAFYSSHGVWEGFRASTSAVGVIGQGFLGKLADLPRIYTADKSSLALIAAALILALAQGRAALNRGPLEFGLVAAVVIPATLQLAAKFPLYYAWMIYGPLSIGVTATLAANVPPVVTAVRFVAVAAIAAACVVGLPARLIGITLLWSSRDPALTADYVTANLAPGDVVVGDFKSYYAVKARAAGFYAPTYLGVMPTEQKQAVTALLLREEDAHNVMLALGGEWGEAAPAFPAGWVEPGRIHKLMREFADENYELHLYRRIDSNRH